MNATPKSLCYACEMPVLTGSLLVCAECLNFDCLNFAEALEEIEIPDEEIEKTVVKEA